MYRFSGYIEGFYGRMLSWDERRLVCDCMDQLSLNTYVYAPKEDPFHRASWRTSYPSSWINNFRNFVKHGAQRDIGVIPCIAPGLSFDYTSRSDYSTLLKKLSAFADCGCRLIGLLMDDIPQTLPNKSRGRFSSLGQAHGLLLACLLSDIRKRYPKLRLWFCPTVYTDQFAPEGIQNCAYLKDLSASIPEDVQLLWTGPSVISQRLDRKALAGISRLFKGNIVIWDNLYANDYCPHKLFAGPYTGRSRSIHNVAKGVLINPTGMPHTDSLLLGVLAAFNSGASPEQAWRIATKKANVDPAFHTVSRFFAPPRALNRMGKLTKTNIARYRAALHHLIWEWKSPLQREWYPFLYMLDTDLALLEKPVGTTETYDWITKKYSLVLSAILSARTRAAV
jgi:hyaluronoglucosaminidase